jgi:hypothetical protein
MNSISIVQTYCRNIAALFIVVLLVACGGGGGDSTGAAASISAAADNTAQSLTVGTAMTSFTPLAASGGATPYTYSHSGTLPAGLSLNTSTGAVTGTPAATYTTANLVFSVKDGNNVVASTTSTVSFTVGAASANISATASTTAQNLTVGTAMTSFSPLTPSGGATPYTYSYTGTLPSGLSLNTSTGAVTGTPTAIYTTANLVFSVKDANNVVASTTSTVSFTVGAASANISAIATTAAKNLTVGTAMASFSPLTASGGATPYTYSYTGTLPAGLSFNTSTGTVTGTPTAAYATANVVFSVKDANNVVASTTSTVSFTVTAMPAGYFVQDGLTWMPVTFYDTWANANTYCTTTIINGQSGWRLPTQAELNALYTSGAMYGRGYSYSPQFTWSSASYGTSYHWGLYYDETTDYGLVEYIYDGFNGFVSCVRVNEVRAYTTAQNLTVGTAMTSFSPLTASGGATPYTYSYTGTLPAGLSFNTSTGAVTGTPTATYATANLVFSVSDANNVVNSTTSTVSFTVVVPHISATATTTAQSLTVGTAMASFTPLTASGGTTPYTYSYTGTLPAGLSFNTSTGNVTGTPNATYATASLIFSVKDANNVVASTTSHVFFTVVDGAVVVARNLNDTGVTANQCYQAGSDTLVACGSAGALALNNAQDGMAGRDANPATNSNTDGKLGFSFTSVTGGCVQDNVTGLMWEVKTADSGLRDWNKTYTNIGDSSAGDASAYPAAVNATNLCGFNDWRLPTADELQSIVDYSVAYPGPTIDASWFPHTKGNWFWSASLDVGDFNGAWYANFNRGGASNANRGNVAFVRLVRTGQ